MSISISLYAMVKLLGGTPKRPFQRYLLGVNMEFGIVRGAAMSHRRIEKSQDDKRSVEQRFENGEAKVYNICLSR